jgi:putative methylase
LQKRMVRKLDLEMAISAVEPHPSPKAYLEQYSIPPEVAAEIVYMATYIYNDVIGKTVIDLGCGTGRLAIAAALLDAKEVVAVDIDKTAIKQAIKNAEKMEVAEKISWIITDIDAIRGNFDTVLQNPPFGVQRRGADRKFLTKALQIGQRVYSLHKATDNTFLKTFIEKNNGEIKALHAFSLTIPYMFKFHRKLKHKFVVNLFVIERKGVVSMKSRGEQKVY